MEVFHASDNPTLYNLTYPAISARNQQALPRSNWHFTGVGLNTMSFSYKHALLKAAFVIIAIIVAANFMSRLEADSAMSQYRLGSGDLIDIRVFNETKLSIKTTLSDTGTISYPLLGELQVAGMTVGELEKHLVFLLKGEDKYLINPKVTVSVSKYRKIFITGEVKKPGSYTYMPGLTVRKSISLAGGFTRRASMNKIFRINGNDPNETQHKVDLHDIVNAGDTITVEESFF